MGDKEEPSPIVEMFLNFGFMDVQMVGEENANILYDLTEHLDMSTGWDLLSYFPQRGLEISEYINKSGLVQNYVILDDDSDMLYIQKDHFIKTDTYKGLSEENVQQAIQILNK